MDLSTFGRDSISTAMMHTVNGSRRVALALVYFVCRGRASGSVNCVDIYIVR
jgi:hypothetical protein